MVVGFFQKIRTVFHHKSYHLIEHLCFLVHVDCEIRFISRNIHFFCVFEVTFPFKLTSLLNLNDCILAFRQISRNHSVGLVPLVGANIHLKRLNEFTCLNEILFRKVELANFCVVTSNLFEVGSCHFSFLAWNKLDGSIPLSGAESRFNRLVENASLNKVFNGLIKLLLARQPVTPFFF
jgi:hypothetical protein